MKAEWGVHAVLHHDLVIRWGFAFPTEGRRGAPHWHGDAAVEKVPACRDAPRNGSVRRYLEQIVLGRQRLNSPQRIEPAALDARPAGAGPPQLVRRAESQHRQFDGILKCPLRALKGFLVSEGVRILRDLLIRLRGGTLQLFE